MGPHTRIPLSETGVTETVPGELKGTSTCLCSRSSHGDHLIKSRGTGGWLGAGRCLQGTSEQIPFAMVWHLRNPVATGEVGNLLGFFPAFSTPVSELFRSPGLWQRRGAGMMGREWGMTAWCSGPLIQNGVNENLPLNPMAKAGVPGWQATAGLSPQPCHSPPLGHGAPHPHPLIRNWGYSNGIG